MLFLDRPAPCEKKSISLVSTKIIRKSTDFSILCLQRITSLDFSGERVRLLA